MKKNIVTFLLTSILVINAQVQTSPKGMRYTINKDVPGEPGKIGDVVKFHIIIQTAAGEELQNTYKMSPQPAEDLIREPKVGWSYEEIFTMLSPGDSATVFVPSDSIFTPQSEQQRPPNIAEHTDLKFTFKVVKTQTMAEYEAEAQQKAIALQAEEDKTILDFIKKNKLVFQKTESGLYYVQKKKGTGVKAKAGDNVKVHYTGRLIDSTKFDSSVDRGQPFEFGLGQHQVIQGWDEGIALMNKGEKGTLLIPSKMGYGERGSPPTIPANSVLLFDVELVDIISSTPPVQEKASPNTKPVQKSSTGKTTGGTKSTGVKPKPATKPKTATKTQLK
jgi:FKBP-type peptidyl-prolyl cis-trans isomerase FkpA